MSVSKRAENKDETYIVIITCDILPRARLFLTSHIATSFVCAAIVMANTGAIASPAKASCQPLMNAQTCPILNTVATMKNGPQSTEMRSLTSSPSLTRIWTSLAGARRGLSNHFLSGPRMRPKGFTDVPLEEVVPLNLCIRSNQLRRRTSKRRMSKAGGAYSDA